MGFVVCSQLPSALKTGFVAVVYRQHCYQLARGRLPDLGVLTVWVGPATAGYDPAPIGTDVDVTHVVLGPQGQCSERRAQVNDCCVRPGANASTRPSREAPNGLLPMVACTVCCEVTL